MANRPACHGLQMSLAFATCLLLYLLPTGQVAAQSVQNFNLSCGNNEVLVGIRGRQGWWMDQIASRCRALNADGTLGTGAATRGSAGGSGGTALGPFDCRSHEVMVGLSGSLGSNGHVLYVHEVICAPWSATTRTAGTPTRTINAFPKKNPPMVSGSWLAQSCFDGQVATTLLGQAGRHVNRLTGLGCRHVAGATPPQPAARPRPVPSNVPITVAPTLIEPSGTYNVALCPESGAPRFRWNAVRHAWSYNVEFRNVSKNRTATDRVISTWANKPGGFLEGDSYEWRVQASNAAGDGPWSPSMQFTGVKGPQNTSPCAIAGAMSYF